MADESTSIIKEVLIVIGAMITTLFGKGAWDWATGKTKAETKHITKADDIAALAAQGTVLKDSYGLLQQATADIKEAYNKVRELEKTIDANRRQHREEIEDVRDQLRSATRFIRKVASLYRDSEKWAELEKEATEILDG